MGGVPGLMRFRIATFPVSADLGFLVGVGLVGVVAHEGARRILPASDPDGIAILVALCFAGSVLLHELGHAIQARANGSRLTFIHLSLLGGVTGSLGADDGPGPAYRAAVAGPLATALIIVVGEVVGLISGWTWTDCSSGLLSHEMVSAPGYVLQVFVAINVFLLAFNLIPIPPLDGGAIVASVLWRVTGRRSAADTVLGAAGVVVAASVALWGLSRLQDPNREAGVLAVITAYLLFRGALATLRHAPTRARVERMTLRDTLMSDAPTGRAGTPLSAAWHGVFEPRPGLRALPVAGADGIYRGAVHRQAIATAVQRGLDVDLDRLVSSPELDELVAVASVDLPLSRLPVFGPAIENGVIVAVDAEGRLEGVTTANAIRLAAMS